MTAGAEPCVVFDDVSKRFSRGTYHDTLRDLIASRLRGFWNGEPETEQDRDFWALRDVSFTVGPGEVLGIIGPNGAGKSTVLKIASGILEPDRGRVEARGRVGALIELSAGFHSELTGAENVYFQGAIMGMSRGEVAAKFDDIVEFAGLGDFVDTPVKRYSSGMKVRLGFAVAAHLEPDVLLVDEVLTVGDLEFQRKANERLREIVDREIPVIIVSHQLDRVTELCDRAILLNEGRVFSRGSAAKCVDDYLSGRHKEGEHENPPPVRVLGIDNAGSPPVGPGAVLRIRVRGIVDDSADADPAEVCTGVRLRTVPENRPLGACNNVDCGVALPESGEFELEIRLRVNVAPGLYRIEGVVWDVRDGLEWTRGPSTLLEVDQSVTVRGTVDLQPEMQRLAP